jgi:hypothetical protein
MFRTAGQDLSGTEAEQVQSDIAHVEGRIIIGFFETFFLFDCSSLLLRIEFQFTV